MRVIILAAGKATRFGSNKQFIQIGDETLIRRMCRQIVERGGKPVIVTQNKNLQRHCKMYEIFKPKYYSTQLHSLLFSYPRWNEECKTIILLGDVIFSNQDMDKIFQEENFKYMVGEESYGLVIPLDCHNIVKTQIKEILSNNPKDYNLSFRLYCSLRDKIENFELKVDTITRDIDTKEELVLFYREVILEDKLD